MAKRCWSCAPEKNCVPVGRGREMIETICQGLQEDGVTVSISKLCQWFCIPRRAVYCRPTKSTPKVQERFAGPFKALIEEHRHLATAS